MNLANASKVRLATGLVETVASKPDRYAVLVKGEWYSAFEPKCPVQEGQQVAIAYIQNGRFRNIQAIEVFNPPLKLSDTVARGGGFGPNQRDRFVAYSVALKAAATCWTSVEGISSDGVKKLAECFAEWLLEKTTVGTVSSEQGVKA